MGHLVRCSVRGLQGTEHGEFCPVSAGVETTQQCPWDVKRARFDLSFVFIKCKRTESPGIVFQRTLGIPQSVWDGVLNEHLAPHPECRKDTFFPGHGTRFVQNAVKIRLMTAGD